MAKNFFKNPWFLSVSSGIALGLASPIWPFDAGFLVFLGLIPLLLALKAAKDLKTAFFFALLTGFSYFLFSLNYLISLHPLTTVGINSRLLSLAIVLAIYFLSAAVMALFWGLAGIALRRLAYDRKSRLFLGPAIFTIFEYFRAYGFGLFWIGAGSKIGPHWTLASLAYSLSANSLILKLASFMGIYGISFFIFFINFLALKLLDEKKLKSLLSLAILILAISVLGRFEIFIESAGRIVNFGIIQTEERTSADINPQEKLDNFKIKLDLLDRLAAEHPETDIVVFPEGSNFFTDLSIFLNDRQAKNYFSGLFPSSTLIVSNSRVRDLSENRSRVFFLDSKKDILGFYDKRVLTPLGEFLPYPVSFLSGIFSQKTKQDFLKIRQFSPGTGPVKTLATGKGIEVSAVVCSELLSPDVFRQAAGISNITLGLRSTGIFRGDMRLERQNLAVAKVQAAQNQKPLLISSNYGLSYAIKSTGRVAGISRDLKPQILTGALALGSGNSWYNRLGDLPVLSVSVLVLVFFFAKAKIESKA